MNFTQPTDVRKGCSGVQSMNVPSENVALASAGAILSNVAVTRAGPVAEITVSPVLIL